MHVSSVCHLSSAFCTNSGLWLVTHKWGCHTLLWAEALGSCGIQEAAGKPQPRGFQGLVPPRLSHTASSRSSIYCISEAPQNPQCNISEAGHGVVALFWGFQWFCNSSGLLTPFLLFSHCFLFLILEITSKTLYSLGGREWVEWSHLLVIPPVIPLWDLNTFTSFFSLKLGRKSCREHALKLVWVKTIKMLFFHLSSLQFAFQLLL